MAAHGFLAMGLEAAFRRGGIVVDAFADGLDRILDAIEPSESTGA